MCLILRALLATKFAIWMFNCKNHRRIPKDTVFLSNLHRSDLQHTSIWRSLDFFLLFVFFFSPYSCFNTPIMKYSVLQTRSPKPSQSPQPNLGDQTEHLSEASADSLEAMSEGDSPTPFSRGSRTRASLPVVRSANQTKERSLGKTLRQSFSSLLLACFPFVPGKWSLNSWRLKIKDFGSTLFLMSHCSLEMSSVWGTG